MAERTADRLARDLERAGAPADMVDRAKRGYYDDYESNLPTPIGQLRKDARRLGLRTIEAGAVAGLYDASREESEAWARRTYESDPEMRKLMDELGLGPRQ